MSNIDIIYFSSPFYSLPTHFLFPIFLVTSALIVTGSVDGFIELWDCDTCKLRKDLDYQMKDELMMHEEVSGCVRERERESGCVRERERGSVCERERGSV